MERTNKLATESILKLILSFAIPATIANFVFATYNIIDRIFIGRKVGSFALSGVSLTFPIFAILIAFGTLVGIGSGTLISLKLGQNKKEDANSILVNAIILFSGIAFILSILVFVFIDKILITFGATENTLHFAKDYLLTITPFFVVNFMAMGMNNIVRAEGNPKIAMKTILIGGIVHILLNPLFIYYMNLGVKGAALSTIIGNFTSAFWIIYHFTKGKKSILKINFSKFKIEKTLVLPVLAIGLSPFSMQLASSLIGVVANKSLLHYGGDIAIGAMGVIYSIVMVIFIPIMGLNQGCQPIIGYNYGAKNYERVKKGLLTSLTIAIVITSVSFLVIMIFPEQIVSMFSKNDEKLTQIASSGMRIFLLMIILAGMQSIIATFFQATGRPKISIFLNMLRQVILFIPLIIILPYFFELNGVWISGAVSDFIGFIITFIFLKKELSKLSILHENKSLI